MIYAKIKNKHIVFVTNIENGHADNEYIPVLTTAKPKAPDGYHYVDAYKIGHDDTTDTDELVQVWELVKD